MPASIPTPSVFVLGATNLLERVDEATLRGGRLSRHIEISGGRTRAGPRQDLGDQASFGAAADEQEFE